MYNKIVIFFSSPYLFNKDELFIIFSIIIKKKYMYNKIVANERLLLKLMKRGFWDFWSPNSML